MAEQHDPLDPVVLFEHVQDSGAFHGPMGLTIELPLHLTKYMVLEVVVAVIMIFLFVSLGRRMSDGSRIRGRFWNLLEVMVVFIRDEVARPAIGKPDADKFLPFILTLFFFVLGCNLIGLVPWAGSATSALATTAALALVTFTVVIGSSIVKLGLGGFVKSFVPHMDLPFVMALVLVPLIFVLEVMGLLIKHCVLAIRLLANMLAGHLVLGVLVAFIAASAHSLAWYGVAPASVLGSTALMMLELFVAFLQAYIFAFLSALFIGMAIHPH